MGTFTLDTSTLSGNEQEFRYDEEDIEDRGRSIILTWEQDVADEDMELHGYTIRYFPAEPDSKESA